MILTVLLPTRMVVRMRFGCANQAWKAGATRLWPSASRRASTRFKDNKAVSAAAKATLPSSKTPIKARFRKTALSTF